MRDSTRDRVRGWLLGGPRNVGLWMVPLFIMVGLLGATLAGGLAVLYYAQQVAEIRESTESARAQLDEAVATVQQVADEARRSIEAQVSQVNQSLSPAPPIASPNDAGVYAVAARPLDGSTRSGSAFTVYSDRRESYLVTNYRLVSTGDGYAVSSAEVFVPPESVTVRVHSFDAQRDLAILVLDRGPLPVLDWRPTHQPLVPGEQVFLAGVSDLHTPAVLPGQLGGVSPDSVVASIPLDHRLAGGPLLDGDGRVVAVSTLPAASSGSASLTLGVPIGNVCLRLIVCTPAD
ncbi:MAG TPA: serine protease, partial [Egibacteraceae bacterium]|nr:serine protease [Egibacteraceae bacterium]